MRLDGGPSDEIGVAYAEFNRMAARLESLVTETSQERSRLMAAINSSVDAVVATDRESNVTFANAAVQDLLGRTPEEIVGRPFVWTMPDAEVIEGLRASRERGEQQLRDRAPEPPVPARHHHADRRRRRLVVARRLPRHDGREASRAGAPRLRGQRLARAAHAAGRDQVRHRNAGGRRGRRPAGGPRFPAARRRRGGPAGADGGGAARAFAYRVRRAVDDPRAGRPRRSGPVRGRAPAPAGRRGWASLCPGRRRPACPAVTATA